MAYNPFVSHETTISDSKDDTMHAFSSVVSSTNPYHSQTTDLGDSAGESMPNLSMTESSSDDQDSVATERPVAPGVLEYTVLDTKKQTPFKQKCKKMFAKLRGKKESKETFRMIPETLDDDPVETCEEEQADNNDYDDEEQATDPVDHDIGWLFPIDEVENDQEAACDETNDTGLDNNECLETGTGVVDVLLENCEPCLVDVSTGEECTGLVDAIPEAIETTLENDSHESFGTVYGIQEAAGSSETDLNTNMANESMEDFVEPAQVENEAILTDVVDKIQNSIETNEAISVHEESSEINETIVAQEVVVEETDILVEEANEATTHDDGIVACKWLESVEKDEKVEDGLESIDMNMFDELRKSMEKRRERVGNYCDYSNDGANIFAKLRGSLKKKLSKEKRMKDVNDKTIFQKLRGSLKKKLSKEKRLKKAAASMENGPQAIDTSLRTSLEVKDPENLTPIFLTNAKRLSANEPLNLESPGSDAKAVMKLCDLLFFGSTPH